MIPLRDQEYLREKFSQELFGQLKIDFFTERELGLTVPGKQPCVTCKPAREMLQELAGLSDWISLRVHYMEDKPEEAQTYGVSRVPAITAGSDQAVSDAEYNGPHEVDPGARGTWCVWRSELVARRTDRQ